MYRQKNLPMKVGGFGQIFWRLFLLLTIFPIAQVIDGQNPPEITPLEPNKSLERELAGEQKHVFKIVSAANQYNKIIIEQRGVDVVARLLGADGKPFLEFDSESRLQGEEVVEFVSEPAGNSGLEIEAKYKLLPGGSYKISFAESRAATERDYSLQEARRLYGEAFNLRRAGKSAAGIPVILRALEICEKNLDKEHPDIARTLNLLGNLYIDTSDFEKGAEVYTRALAIRKKVFGENHPSVAQTLSDLGVLYRRSGKPDRAEQLFRESLTIREKLFGTEHPEFANILQNLGNVALDRGDFIEAKGFYTQALAIRDKAFGKNSPATSPNLNNLAIVYEELGDYVKAESIYLRVMSIDEKIYPPDHPNIASDKDNLAGTYREMGDLATAEKLYKSALEIREKVLGPDDLTVSATLNNLGNLYDDKDDFAAAEKAYLRSLEIRRLKLKTEDHPWIAQSLYNLGDLYWKTGDFPKAETYLLDALTISEKVLEPDSPLLTYPLLGLANLYRDLGNFEKSESLYLRVISIYDESLGKEHPRKAKILQGLAKLYLAKGDFGKAVLTQSEANRIAEKNISFNLAVGSEQRKLDYLVSLSELLDNTLTLNFFAKDRKDANELALLTIFERKGRVLDAMSDTLSALRRRFNAEDQGLLDKLNETNAKLAILVLNGPNKTTIAEHQQKINALEENRNQLETEVSRRAAGFYESSKPITLEAVRKNIPENAVLIEFAVYHPILPKDKKSPDAKSEPRYVAYVAGQTGEIQMKDLGRSDEIDAAIDAFRRALLTKGKDVKELSQALDTKIMKPLRLLVGDKKQLLISPDGNLNLIPFEALVDEQNHFLIENYSFSYLTSGRDLLRMQIARQTKNNPLLIANPSFGEPDSTLGLLKADKPPAKPRPSLTATRNLSDTYFAPLGGTAQEARAIQTLFPSATALTEKQATESALKQTTAPRILHIATHGFFLEDKDISGAKNQIENPLLRSGLALAGANRRDGTQDDGILTALEASGLNLWGTKLVVLSACDTGLGEIRNGEGVYGLRRAFTLAGTETLVMSLWSVSDLVTREMMTKYYKNLKAGLGRGAALRQVQLEMLKKANRAHPFYWASFIESGDWANLDGKR